MNPTQIKFRIYVAGDAENSIEAIANLTAFCNAHLPERHEIEIVDVSREPLRALEEGVLMTPTLVKLAPPPVRRIVGTLNETQLLLHVLGSDSLAA